MTGSAVAPEGPRRVAITGSCVSRDTIEYAGPQRFDVTAYVARQSLISAWSDASARFPDGASIPSAFQERMMRGDFAGDLEQRLDAARDVDLVLWDIVDERHGVHVFADDTVVTRSVDNLTVPEVAEVIDKGRHIPFGSAEHYALWSEGAIRLVSVLERLELLDRTTVLEVPWARTTAAGEPTPLSMGMSADRANRLSRPYYARLRGLGLPVLEIAEDAAIADPEHRWGPAPFHYTADVYQEILDRLG